MIRIIDLANKVQAYLHAKGFDDFKVFIRLNFSIDVFVFSDVTISEQKIKDDFIRSLKDDKDNLYKKEYYDIEDLDENNNPRKIEYRVENDIFYHAETDFLNLSFKIIPSDEKDDPFYASIVNYDEEIVIGPRYRFDSLLNSRDKGRVSLTKDIPIVTFYSYKGGMGRTTTMVSYAMDLAIHRNKRIVVIDCDLEAPGYLNFFDLSANKDLRQGRKNGLVEFMSDLNVLNDEGKEKLELSDYIVNVGDSANINEPALNNIWLIPAGNLNMNYAGVGEEINLRDYLEGLSKINLSNVNEVVGNFKILIDKIKNLIEPDIILIDSRTGFNDIFGTAAFYLSSCVVGFFGFSRQTQPGLINLVNNYYSQENLFKMIMVFSILPTDKDSQILEDELYHEVNDMMERKGTEKKEKPMYFSLHRNHCLEQIGIGEKTNDEAFVKLVRDKGFNDYNSIFEAISDICWEKPKEEEQVQANVEYNTNVESKQTEALNVNYTEDTPSLILRNVILRHLKTVFSNIKLFAEDTKIEEGQFFYRKCMQDFFGPDKFIIKGYKGTGKTYLYRALADPVISKKIQSWTNPSDPNEIIFIQVLPDSPNSNVRAFPFENIRYKAIDEPEYYFNCFWQIYTWNSILCNDSFTTIRKESRLSSYIKPIDGNEAFLRFEELIEKGIEVLVTIEEDLDKVNNWLCKNNKKIFLLYDRLDNCINPLRWNKAVSPLIEYWRNNYRKYSNIFPKIFIRTDLFRQIEGNNTERLQENSINIEWTIGEVFGYFFKLIFSDKNASNAYWAIAKKLRINENYISDRRKSFIAFPLNQFKSLTRAEMAPLIEIFFGRQVNPGNSKLGHPWEYFEKELSNADNNSISLRPFINTLDGNAVDKALGRTERYVKEIISPNIYASKDVREKATESYFDDLAKDPFSKDLLKLRDFIRSDKGNNFKYKSLTEAQYAHLLKEVFASINGSEVVKTEKDLDNMISANGIIARKPTSHGIYYVFAPIYFYSWGLQNGDLEKENKQGNKKEEINLKRSPEEGIEYHGQINRNLYGNRSYIAVPNASERLNITSFKIENKPLALNEGDNIIFTVFSEPNYTNNGKLFWKVKNISLDE